MKTHNILIGDDHAFIRMGMKQAIINSLPASVFEAGDGKEVLQILQNQAMDLVVLDISMPGRDGMEILKDIQVRFPKVKVLMLSSHAEEQYALRALKAGAFGYITKDKSPVELVNAIAQVLKGEKYLSPSLAQLLVKEMTGESVGTNLHSLLSDQEFAVFLKLGGGLTVSEIANEMDLSVKTVSTYRTRILAKTGLRNNADIVQYVVSSGLLSS